MTRMPASRPAPRTRSAAARRAGYTLVELLVVVAIIMLLTGMICVWAVGAWRANKVRATHATMNAALALAQTLEQKALVKPDHRLANFYWVQPHVASPAAAPAAGARQMSSAEFLVWLSANASATSSVLESIGTNALLPSPKEPAWTLVPGVSQESGTDIILVDVYEQHTEKTLPLLKQPLSTNGSLPVLPAGASWSRVSGPNGYRLRTLVDAWRHELVYRRSAHAEILNAADTETPAAPFNTLIRERVVKDEAVSVARYQAQGQPVPSGELLRPALPAYPQPQLLSAGPDGRWGAFTDGSPPRHSPEASKAAGRDRDAQDNISSIEWGR